MFSNSWTGGKCCWRHFLVCCWCKWRGCTVNICTRAADWDVSLQVQPGRIKMIGILGKHRRSFERVLERRADVWVTKTDVRTFALVSVLLTSVQSDRTGTGKCVTSYYDQHHHITISQEKGEREERRRRVSNVPYPCIRSSSLLPCSSSCSSCFRRGPPSSTPIPCRSHRSRMALD